MLTVRWQQVIFKAAVLVWKCICGIPLLLWHIYRTSACQCKLSEVIHTSLHLLNGPHCHKYRCQLESSFTFSRIAVLPRALHDSGLSLNTFKQILKTRSFMAITNIIWSGCHCGTFVILVSSY